MTRTSNRTQAVHQPVPKDALTGTTATDAGDMDLGDQDRTVELDQTMSLEDLRDSLNSQVSHSLDDPAFKKFVADTEFMEEKVLVQVHTSTDPHAEKIVEVFCNGIPQRFIRGEFVIARRKYVEILARARPFSVNTPEVIDANGDRTTRIDTKTALRYPFEMRDRNPMGNHWLQSILNEPA